MLPELERMEEIHGESTLSEACVPQFKSNAEFASADLHSRDGVVHGVDNSSDEAQVKGVGTVANESEDTQENELAQKKDAKEGVGAAQQILQGEQQEGAVSHSEKTVTTSNIAVVPTTYSDQGTSLGRGGGELDVDPIAKDFDSRNDVANETNEDDEDLLREIEMLEGLVRSAEAAANEKGKLLDYSKTLEQHINKLEALATK
jgi:hypothetical protein